ncbi:MAG TPA: PilN domain-containing protein [Gaiellaceae bacterium]|jgi:Tfp pilus assembly protein PilN
MDLNKEIKLSDLFKRGKKDKAADDAAEEVAKEPKQRRSLSFRRAAKDPDAPKQEKKAKVDPKSAPAIPSVPLMRAFNLMPKEVERQKASASPLLTRVAVPAVAVLVLVGLGAGFMLMDARVGEKRAQADDLRAQLAELTAQAGPDQGQQGAATIAGEGQARTGALAAALGGRIAWDRILREFTLVLPEDVWVTAISAASGGSTTEPAPGQTTPGGSTFTITGFARYQASVAQLLSRLSVIPEFSSVQLQSSARGADPQNQDVYSFSIVATLAPEGTAS